MNLIKNMLHLDYTQIYKNLRNNEESIFLINEILCDYQEFEEIKNPSSTIPFNNFKQ